MMTKVFFILALAVSFAGCDSGAGKSWSGPTPDLPYHPFYKPPEPPDFLMAISTSRDCHIFLDKDKKTKCEFARIICGLELESRYVKMEFKTVDDLRFCKQKYGPKRQAEEVVKMFQSRQQIFNHIWDCATQIKDMEEQLACLRGLAPELESGAMQVSISAK